MLFLMNLVVVILIIWKRDINMLLNIQKLLILWEFQYFGGIIIYLMLEEKIMEFTIEEIGNLFSLKLVKF